jgi:four helix bundle protein
MYRKLNVYKKSVEITIEVYRATKKFPKEELFGLVSQMRRCATSIPSNIAEGSKFTNKKFFQFIRISIGSDCELRTQMEISNKLEYLENGLYVELEEKLTEIIKMLHGMIK